MCAQPGEKSKHDTTMHNDDIHLESEDEQEHDYSERQRSRDADYKREYDLWVNSLTPEERRKLADMGLGAPSVPGKAGGSLSDVASSSRARCESRDFDDDEPDDDGGSDDEPEQSANAQAGDAGLEREQKFDIVRRLIGEMMGQDNSRLALECLALVSNLAYDGSSMTEIAKRHGITRAAVSKRCVELTLALDLMPSRAMRSLNARHSYRQSRLNHLHTLP